MDCFEKSRIAETGGLAANTTGSGKYTKEEIAGIVFSKFRPQPHHIFADIGCGSGRVAEFFAPYVRKVYAVDSDEEAVHAASKRLDGLENVEVMLMDGRDFLKEYDCNLIFFGGTKGIDEMLKLAAEKTEKIAVNAARIEVAANVISSMKGLGVFREALIVNISRSYQLSGGTAFKSLNPVFVVIGCL
jgi:precorrin-6B methylase 2